MGVFWPYLFIRLRQETLQLALGMIGLRLHASAGRLRPDSDGETNHGEAGPSQTG
jgi:hypothetical protein